MFQSEASDVRDVIYEKVYWYLDAREKVRVTASKHDLSLSLLTILSADDEYICYWPGNREKPSFTLNKETFSIHWTLFHGLHLSFFLSILSNFLDELGTLHEQSHFFPSFIQNGKHILYFYSRKDVIITIYLHINFPFMILKHKKNQNLY